MRCPFFVDPGLTLHEKKIPIFTSIFAHTMSNGLFTFFCQPRLCNIIVVEKSEQYYDQYFFLTQSVARTPEEGVMHGIFTLFIIILITRDGCGC